MRKILEVLQSSTGELTFNTDIDVEKDATIVMDIMSSAMFSMATKLWGGNEQSIIAVIRALFISDMAISTDGEFIMKGIMKEAAHMGKLFNDMMAAMEARGIAQSFAPGVPRPGDSNACGPRQGGHGPGVRTTGKKKMS